jgi:hypothetical protein
MPEIDDLLRRFIERYESGEPIAPADLLAQVQGTDRKELEALLDAYLARAPRRPFSAEAFASSPARPVVDDLAQSLEGIAGTWPVVLPRLRSRARLRRSELVSRLAAALGVADREAKVAVYYHAMEQGELDPAGVSDRVLDALARLTGTTARALRDAASAFEPGGVYGTRRRVPPDRIPRRPFRANETSNPMPPFLESRHERRSYKPPRPANQYVQTSSSLAVTRAGAQPADRQYSNGSKNVGL